MIQPSLPGAHKKSSGAGSTIISLLEVVESDFAKDLSRQELEEADSLATYEATKQDDDIARTKMEREATFKTKEAKTLEKDIAELVSSKDSTDAELAAVMEYYTKLKDRCVAKPATYEMRKERREAEILGLQSALRTLEGEEALVQRPRRSQRFRGSLTAGAQA